MTGVVDYERNVFINCPFDADYQPMFNAIVFAVTFCGFIPRCAKEEDDSDEIRILKIIKLIGQCQYGIHDLSRVETAPKLPRFNMPLELGIFIGCQKFGDMLQTAKRYLILESQNFRFREFISDLSGQDIKNHENNEVKAIGCVRDWLSPKLSKSRQKTLPHASRIAQYYERFQNDLPVLCLANEWTIAELTFLEYYGLATIWIQQAQTIVLPTPDKKL